MPFRFLAAGFILSTAMITVAHSENGLAAAIDIPFTKYVLDNGLRLIVHEDPKAPIVAVNVWYHVGSKNEKQGKTGFAHLFEHLMFNGTEHFDDDYFIPLEKAGATDMNGTTNNDRTNYFQNVPTSALDLALWMESDRMGHLLGAIDQEKLDEQRGVVQNEKRQGENQPYGVVRELLTVNTYPKGHPYSWTVIGSMEDLDAADLPDVHNWFQEYYGAANAVLSVAGDVKAEDVKAAVEKYFGDIPAGPPVARHEVWIAKREGAHRQKVEDRVPQARLYKVWNIPQWGSEEGEHLNLVSDVLSLGKSSRFYKRLVYEDQIATDVSAYVALREIAGQFVIVATAKPGVDLAKVEAAVDEELARLINDGPTKEEMERVRTQYLARVIRGAERIGGFGGKSDLLAMSEIYGGRPDYYKTTLDQIRSATAEDLQNAAETWLTGGVYVLEVHPYPEYATKPAAVDRSEGVPSAGEPPAATFPDIQRATLSNGLKVVLAERHAVPVVNFDLVVNAGFAADPADAAGLASMTLDMIDEGTKNRSTLEISDALARLGAELYSGSSLDTSTLGISALKANLEPSLQIFADVLLNPSFDPAEFSRRQAQRIAGIEQEKASPELAGRRILPALIYGAHHPYGRPSSGSGTIASVKAMTADTLREFHGTWFKPNNATLVIVGDITLDEVVPLLEKQLAAWKPADVPSTSVPAADLPDKSRVYVIDRPGAQQSYIFAAHVAPPTNDPNDLAIDTMNRVLGGSFTSRINMNLREDKHWSYGARSSLMDAVANRMFVASAPVQTDKTRESLIEIKKEIDGILGAIPITDDELIKSQANLTLRLPGQWETADAVKSSLRRLLIFGLPEDHYDTYATRVAALKLEDLAEAARNVIKPNQLTWVVVGDRAKIEEGVREANVGEVHIVTDEAEILSTK